jgi:predicted dehydrogenase
MNVGIFGLGFMGATHAVRYSWMPDVSISAVCSRNEERLCGKFSKQGGNLGLALPDLDLRHAAKYRDWKLLVADPTIEVVDICSPSNLHREMTVAALRAGKHVLCEKPMALTVEDCDWMIAAATEANRRLMIGHVLRFWPAYEYLKQWVQAEGATHWKSVEFRRKSGVPDWSLWLTHADQSGGALLDLLIHDLDQVQLLFGMPRAVGAKRVGDYDAIDASLIYTDGLNVKIQGGWFESDAPFSMGFQLEAAEAGIRFDNNVVVVTDHAGKERQIDLAADDAYEKQLSYFLQCCRTGYAPDLCPPGQSRAAVQVALLLKQSQLLGGAEIACEQ